MTMPNDTPAPTAPSGEAQTLSEMSEDVAQAISELESASRSVGEYGFHPGRERIVRVEREARAELEAAILGFVASLSTERARMERERDAWKDAAESHEKNYLTVKDWHAEAVSDYDDEREKSARLTSELDRVRGALDAAVDSIDWRHSPKCNGNSLSGGCSCGLRRFRALRATALSGLSTPDATTKEPVR